MVWVLGFFIFVAALSMGLLWSRRRRQQDLEAAIDPLGGSPRVTPRIGSWPRQRQKAPATPPRPVRPVILVATFDNDGALKRAAEAFDAAEFTSEDYVCIYQNRNVASAFAYRMKLPCSSKLPQRDEDCSDSVTRMQDLMNSRRPVVIVRRRFMKACEIIEMTGGRLGCGRT